MGFLSRIFNKRQREPKVFLKTKKNLSEAQKNTIITIVKNGIASDAEPSEIAINIMMSTGIYDVVFLRRVRNGMKVIF